MLEWISDNNDLLNSAVNILMCLIWLLYLQLIYSSYRRQRKPKIIISHINKGSSARDCIISNLSAEAIYIHNLVIQLCTKNGCDIEAAVTDPGEDHNDNTNEENIITSTNQGPLKSGEYRHIGSFRNFIDRTLANHKEKDSGQAIEPNNISSLNIIVIASYGADNTPIAAKREFYFGENNNLMPASISTTQIRSHIERRKLAEYIKNIIYS